MYSALALEIWTWCYWATWHCWIWFRACVPGSRLQPTASPNRCCASCHMPITGYCWWCNSLRYLKLEISEVCNQSLNVGLFVNSTTGYLVVYVCSKFRNPNQRLHDRRLEFGPGESENLTSVNEDDCSRSRRRRQTQTDPQQQFLYLGVVARNGSVTLSLHSTVMDTPGDRLLSSSITEPIRSEDTLSFSCATTCSCPDASVTWELDGYTWTLPSTVQVTTSQDGRQATLTLNLSDPDYSGRYSCVVHSTNVLTTAQTTIDVPLNCENNGTNIGLYLYACVPGWTGLACEQCKLAQELTCIVSCHVTAWSVHMTMCACGVFSVSAS